MIAKLRHRWNEARDSFWFVPAVIVVGAVALAGCLVALDTNVELQFDKRWPLVFGSGADGSRSLLMAVAGSMITVAGVVFSITIVALSLTSSQYTSRVLRNFMRDRMNQAVLGVFVGIFAYCLVVLRTIRGGDEGAFVPSLAVIGGLALAFVGIAFLIFFIHHIALSIQASSIIAAVALETIEAIDHLFPKELADEAADGEGSGLVTSALGGQVWCVVKARKMGYIESIDAQTLLALARKHNAIVRMELGIGEFVMMGLPLVSLAGVGGVDESAAEEMHDVYVISRQRTVQQDAGFGIRQIVDVAMKALSPGLNDTTTAVMCVDYLGAIVARLASRVIAPAHRFDQGELRVIAKGGSFEGLLAEAFDQLRQNARGNGAVLTRQLQTLDIIAGQTVNARRRQALRKHAELINDEARRTITTPYDCAGVEAAFARLLHVLDATPIF